MGYVSLPEGKKNNIPTRTYKNRKGTRAGVMAGQRTPPGPRTPPEIRPY